MPTQIELLATLQLVDQALRDKQRITEESEGRVAALEQSLRAQTGAAEAARAELTVLSARQRDLEARLTTSETKLRDRRMRITRIRNEKELGLARREVDLLKEEVGTIETELVGALEQVEAATAKLVGIDAEVASLSTSMETEARELREQIAKVSGEMAGERARRETIAETIDADLRRRYELIFARRGGVAVVWVRGGTCQGCNMRVPPQHFIQIQRGEQVIVCQNCQRILFWRPESEEEATG